MFTLNTKLSEYLNEGLKKNKACNESIAFFSALVAKNPNITAKDAFKLDLPEGWVVQTLKDYDGIFDEKVRKECFKKIKDPMTAFQLHIELKNLDKDDDKILSSVFKGKLPTAEKELRDGIVCRKKNANN